MNVNNPNELYHFLIGNGLVGICPEAQNLVACMDILSRMCACDPPEAKQARLNQCKQHYVAFAARASGYSATLLTKTNDNRIHFYLNGQLIGSVAR
jgi:hypothetical protein